MAVAREFYVAVLAVLGLRVIDEQVGAFADFGIDDVMFSVETPSNRQKATVGNGVHIAFHVGSREIVDTFFDTAIEAGGQSDGEPGVRPEYGEHYYAAFVRDPEGNKIEAVCYSPE